MLPIIVFAYLSTMEFSFKCEQGVLTFEASENVFNKSNQIFSFQDLSLT